jgi:hypothetical protein
MKQPNLNTILRITEIDNKIKKLYETKANALKQIKTKFGDGPFTYQLLNETEDGHKYVRFGLVDNIEKLKSGETVYKNTGINQLDTQVNFLKREPKEWKSN